MGKKINWGMLVSHHPPCQFDRTFKILNIRFCVRCTAILLGILFYVFLLSYIALPESFNLLIGFILPIPAILNFILNELGFLINSNLKRLITGLLLGISIGILIKGFLKGDLILGFAILTWIIILEFIVVLILNKAKVLDKFIKEYENAVYKESN